MYVRNMMAQRVRRSRASRPSSNAALASQSVPGVFQSDFPIPTFHSADFEK